MKNGLFGRLFGSSGKESSRDIAKKRLQFALIYDKLEISDELLECLQQDIVDVISKYFEIDKDSLKLDIERQDDLSALVLNTPILSAKKNYD
ncbi:MAG: cell division topological specificity factor MinE [Thermodesulfobacteriota bacterium]